MQQARILIAEDDALLRQLYQDTLSEAGFTIETAIDGEDALAKMKNGGYDVVLLDIIMPKVDGLTIARQLKEQPGPNPNKKIVFLSNLDNEQQKKQALALGDGYIIKSNINPGQLLEQVQGLVTSV